MSASESGNTGKHRAGQAAAVFFAFLLGALVGRWTAPEHRGSGPDHHTQRAQTTVGAGKRNIPADSARPRSSTHRHAAARSGASADSGRTVSLPAATLDALATTAGRVRVPKDELFSKNDPVVEALGIGENEKLRLEDHWRSALDQLRKAEVANANFEEAEDGSVSFRIAPLTELRDALRSEFAEAVKRELGPDRGAAFLAFKGGSQLFAGGNQPVDCHVSLEPAGNGNWRFRIEQSQGEQRKVWVADAIPPELRHLTDAAGIVRRVHDPATEPDNE